MRQVGKALAFETINRNGKQVREAPVLTREEIAIKFRSANVCCPLAMLPDKAPNHLAHEELVSVGECRIRIPGVTSADVLDEICRVLIKAGQNFPLAALLEMTRPGPLVVIGRSSLEMLRCFAKELIKFCDKSPRSIQIAQLWSAGRCGG